MKVKRGWAFVDDVAGAPSAFSKEVQKDIPTFEKDKPLEIDETKLESFEKEEKIEVNEANLDIFETESISDYDANGNFIGGRNAKSS